MSFSLLSPRTVLVPILLCAGAPVGTILRSGLLARPVAMPAAFAASSAAVSAATAASAACSIASSAAHARPSRSCSAADAG